MTGFILVGAAFLAFIFTVYVIAAAEEGLWPFHRILRPGAAILRSNQRPSDLRSQ